VDVRKSRFHNLLEIPWFWPCDIIFGHTVTNKNVSNYYCCYTDCNNIFCIKNKTHILTPTGIQVFTRSQNWIIHQWRNGPHTQLIEAGARSWWTELTNFLTQDSSFVPYALRPVYYPVRTTLWKVQQVNNTTHYTVPMPVPQPKLSIVRSCQLWVIRGWHGVFY